ncbi:hypothetical protein [Marinobacterium weihaiense]|uniref:Uncharacterized protein n=1 Tax=Marinobacterium weihaiense TaxID=2851016 RepID=A0ABS6M9H9_9GAMM|nr:hypothetical protein [Marinobacterium weihaiense]MBV0932835.1 hypothetical protein [Marinobacterium weihaiense]
MGLLLGPLVLFWVGIAAFSLRMGWVMLEGRADLMALSLALGSLLAFAYLGLGLSRFRGLASLWAFEIPLFFAAGKLVSGACILIVLAYLFTPLASGPLVLKAFLFVLVFALSAGTLAGVFGANAFMQHYRITPTY